MDAIDRISAVFEVDVRDRLQYLNQLLEVVDTSPSIAAAARRIRRERLVRRDVKLCSVMFRLPSEIQKLEMCLSELPPSRVMARKVLNAMFMDDEKFFTFNQEVCFSYACKMLAGMGPMRCHFSNCASLTASDIQKAELDLAFHSPSLFTGPDLSCHEQMESPRTSLPSMSELSTPSTISSSEIGHDLESHNIGSFEVLLDEGDHAEDSITLV
jgi:hypothetical protein